MFAKMISLGTEGTTPFVPVCSGPGYYPKFLADCRNGYVPENGVCKFGNL